LAFGHASYNCSTGLNRQRTSGRRGDERGVRKGGEHREKGAEEGRAASVMIKWDDSCAFN